MIEWHLADLMKASGLRNKDLAYKTELHHVTISKLKHSKMPERIESSTLEKLCIALECNPGDLIQLKQPFPERTDPPDQLSDLSQKERLPVKGDCKESQSIEDIECDRTSNTAFGSHLPYELFSLATTINYCAETLTEELQKIPQETKEQLFPLLDVLCRACKKQLSIFHSSEQTNPEAMLGLLRRS